MKIKSKGIVAGLIFFVLMSLLVLLTVFTASPEAASAATYSDSGKYRLDIDAKLQITSTSTAYSYEAYLYGGSTSGSVTTVSSGAVFTFSPKVLEIVIPAGSSSSYHQFYGRVYDVSISGPVSFSASSVNNGSTSSDTTVTYTLSGLTDGSYTLSFTKDEYYYSSTTGGTINQYRNEQTVTFSFTVDVSAPTISGASTSATGKYTNAAFTVTASDSGSGVKAVYMRAPDSSTFYSAGTSSATVNSGSTNGRYTFYAEDKAGNKSGYYYVNFDDTLPVLTCTGAAFGTNTNSGFTVTASDNSGSVTLYYKIDGGSWAESGSSYTVSDTADDGTYYFYAADRCGNQTDAERVQVGAELYGEFVKSDTDNAVYFTWERSSWTATLDGDPYVKNTWITAEGEHTVKLSSSTKTAVYTYTIAHNYAEQYSAATCTEEGTLSYRCTQCGASYVAYSLEETGHYYVASTVAATCTSGGYTVYTCTRCGDSYTDNYTNPFGHNYSETYKAASCTEYGKTVFTCQVCGSSYDETDGTYPTGHNYTVTVVTSPTCTTEGLLRSICDECGDTFDTVIAANGHNYTITDIVSSGGITARTYTCTECGESYTQELGDQYEEVANYVEYLFGQYSPYMWWVLLAAAGIWSIVIGVMIAIARKNEDKEKAKKMLVNYVIGLVVIAVIVVACPYLIRGIAALIT